jgi:hypothetical protein
MRVQKRKASLFTGFGELASLEITQSRARQQTPGMSKPGFSVSGSFSGSSRQALPRFADGRTRLQQQNHLVSIDSSLRAQRNHFGDRALQRFFLRNGERLGQGMV